MSATNEPLLSCPDCKTQLPFCDGPVHAYLGGNAACWKLYGDVLAREYSDLEYWRYHRWTVDAYTAQHPGKPDPRATQSVYVHLLALHLQIDHGSTPSFIATTMKRVAHEKKGKLEWLEPPAKLGEIAVAHVFEATNATEHGQRVQNWGKSVWAAWQCHHGPIRELAREFLQAP